MSETRYAFYLRPSYAMSRVQTEMHDLLQQQFGLEAAGRFMPHATIKGFFRSEAEPREMIARLDDSLERVPSFDVFNNGVVGIGTSAIVIDIQHLPGGDANRPLQALHEAALDALLPLVSSSCDFTPREWLRERFYAHLTLAMADIPAPLFAEVLAFIREAEPVGPARFTAEWCHLWEFTSADWPGPWWETLRWRFVRGWRLAPSNS